MKTWAVLRQLILGRRVVVIDKKYQTDIRTAANTRSLARKPDMAPVQFRIGGGGSRINILDPDIAARLNEDSQTTVTFPPLPVSPCSSAPSWKKPSAGRMSPRRARPSASLTARRCGRQSSGGNRAHRAHPQSPLRPGPAGRGSGRA